MKKGRLYNRQEIELISKSAIGKSVNDILNEELKTVVDKGTNKGGFGQLIEKYLFGIDNNSDSEPDFMPAGIELKVTPYKKIKGGRLSAKERLVLNIIDYMTEYKNEFKSSHFWYKNNKIQLLWYLWEANKDKKDLIITNEELFELEKNEDLKQIEADWNYIIKKIKDGKAHEISEADTMYLGACSKGANALSTREQPFNNVPAMQRAFCFKNSYMTELVRKHIGNYSNVEKILKNTSNTFNEFINNVINKYKGKTQKELMKEFNIDSKAKNINSMIISRMFNVKIELAKTEEFLKAKIIPKTIRIEKNGTIKESMSFPDFDFKELIEEKWDNSTLREELETTKYLLCIFKNDGRDYIFKGIKLWNMPEITINDIVKPFWLKTKQTIINGIKFTISDNCVKNNLPGISDNGVIHVRPHAGKSAYKLNNGYIKGDITKYANQLPNGEWMTKQCFWFNNTYIKSLIEDLL